MIAGPHHPPAPPVFEKSALVVLEEAAHRHRIGEPPWRLFDRRIRTHHEAHRDTSAQMLSKDEDKTAAFKKALNSPEPFRQHSLYIHVPYCPSICTFCAFFRQPLGNADLDVYVDAVCRQIERTGSTEWAATPLSSVYFGGGTPTTLSENHFVRILTALNRHFVIRPTTEVTVESRCHGTTPQYWDTLSDYGVNRASLGVQTFNTQLRRSVGRKSDMQGVRKSIQSIHDAGLPCVSIDLIYNLPSQEMESWIEDLTHLRSLPIDGASVYALIPFPLSTMVQRIEAGLQAPLRGVDTEYRFYQRALHFLSSWADWKRFSPFHFGHRTRERNTYNETRSGSADVLGIGAGAGGRIGSFSMMNPMSIESYIQSQQRDSDDAAIMLRQPPVAPTTQDLFSFSERLSCEVAQSDPAVDAKTFEALRHLRDAGLVTNTGSGWSLTDTGGFWSYNIAFLLRACSAELN